MPRQTTLILLKFVTFTVPLRFFSVLALKYRILHDMQRKLHTDILYALKRVTERRELFLWSWRWLLLDLLTFHCSSVKYNKRTANAYLDRYDFRV